MMAFFSHAEPIWLYALWTPLYSFWSFRMAIEEYTEVVGRRNLFIMMTYMILGFLSALATPLIIMVPWLSPQ